MKSYLVISFLLILFLFSNLKAQTLVKENKLWSNTSIGTEHGDHYHSYFIKFKGDTTINNVVYKKVLRSDDEDQLYWYIYGAIREDSTKKVYTYDTHYQAGEQLLYDFSLQVGDSILPPYHPFYMYVAKIKYLTLEFPTDTFKQIEFSDCLGCSDISMTWIEGIGSIGGIFNGLTEFRICCIEGYLVCHFENDTLKYQNQKFSTCFPHGFPESITRYNKRIQQIKILYDKNQIIFDFGGLITYRSKLKIFSLNGNIKASISLDGEKNLILPTKYLVSGFYIYTFQNKVEILSGSLIITQE